MSMLDKIKKRINERCRVYDEECRHWHEKGEHGSGMFCAGKVCGLIEAKKMIEDLSNDDDWIPVAERQPENKEYETYLCTLDGELCGLEEPFTGMCGYENGKWDEDCVIAWMPLPEPYQPKICTETECPYNNRKDCPAAAGCAGYQGEERDNDEFRKKEES